MRLISHWLMESESAAHFRPPSADHDRGRPGLSAVTAIFPAPLLPPRAHYHRQLTGLVSVKWSGADEVSMLEQQPRAINHLSEVNGANHKPQAHSGFFLCYRQEGVFFSFFCLVLVFVFSSTTKWLRGEKRSMRDGFGMRCAERGVWAPAMFRVRC